MFAAAEAMEFERAAAIRDRIGKMREQIGNPVSAVPEREGGKKAAANANKATRPNGKAAFHAPKRASNAATRRGATPSPLRIARSPRHIQRFVDRPE